MALPLSEVVELAKKQDWSHPANFSVDLMPIDSDYANSIKWNNPSMIQKQIDICLKSVDVPQHSTASIEEYLGTKWHQANSRDELFTCTMTFRDLNGGEMYRRFKRALELTKINYPSRCFFNINIFLDSEYYETSGRTLIMSTNDALLRSVSQMQLSHENGSEILEFSVEFKFNTPDYNKEFTGLSNNQNISGANVLDQIKTKGINYATTALSKGINKISNKVISGINSYLENW